MGFPGNWKLSLILILSFFNFVYVGLYHQAESQLRGASIPSIIHRGNAKQQQIGKHPTPPDPVEQDGRQHHAMEIWRISQEKDKRFPCDDYTPSTYFGRRGNYWVLYNYFKASRTFLCDESITYTTHSDWTFLDNLLPLLERWQGPLSITLYGPGWDFDESLKRIQYLRECIDSPLIKEFVTFHIFFGDGQLPTGTLPLEPELLPVDCSAISDPLPFGEGLTTYRDSMNLTYPVNVGRNIAKEMSTTRYIFPSDIELYPSPNLIPTFLEMIRTNGMALQKHSRRVFVLPIFELEARVSVLPRDKPELIQLLRDKSAVTFHKYVCLNCHQIPNASEWLSSPWTEELNVFHISKRHKPYHHWEPIYIGTKDEPMFDERLSWDGMKDKRVLCFILCLLDYEFHILDNAFLVHRPGVKGRGKAIVREKRNRLAVRKQDNLIFKVIIPQLKRMYGEKAECHI